MNRTSVAAALATAPSVSRRRFLSYRSIWRWHFYAGLFCVPFVVILAITGSIYLFKPQVEAMLDRPYDRLTAGGRPASAEAQADAAVAAVPGSHFMAFEVRRDARDAARIVVGLDDGSRVRVYVRPDARAVLKILREDQRFMETIKTIHGELLLGEWGSILVELAASWALVMVVTGLYLWWPRQAKGLAGVLYPRLRAGGRIFWRDLHAVIGVWVSAFALVLLLTALPWTTVWAGGFDKLRAATGLDAARRDWTQGRAAEHAEHAVMHAGMAHPPRASLSAMAASVRPLDLAPPVLIAAPTPNSPQWTARSDTQNRPLRVTLTLDPATGRVLDRAGFESRHPVDQAVGYGIAAHEGQLFGVANQILGVLTALGLILLSVSGYVMWWKRRPSGELGAPAAFADERIALGLAMIIVAFGVFLPLLGASVIAVAILDRLVLARIAPVRQWLGLKRADSYKPVS